MPRTNFENLRVYRLAESLGQCVWTVVSEWDSFARFTVGMQLVKSADSIGANIAEGSGRSSVADRRLFVRIARGSLYETKHWLRCAYHRNLLSEKAIEELKRFMDTLTPQLNAYYRSIGETKPKVDSSVSIEAPAIQGDYTSGAKSDRLHQVSSLSETSTGLHEPQQIM